MQITREIAQKVLDVVDAGLVSGIGRPTPGKMCVEAAVCFVMGLPHGDDPGCVTQSLRLLKIYLNDAAWSSNQTRAAGLRRLSIAQLGSAGMLDDTEFVRRIVDMTIRKSVAASLRAAASVNPAHAEALEAAAVWCETKGTRDATLNGERVALAAARATSAERAASAAWAAGAAWVTAWAASAASAAWAAERAASAAGAAGAASAASAESAAWAAAFDKSLAAYAEWVVEILIDMQAPGCQWLDLTPKSEAA